MNGRDRFPLKRMRWQSLLGLWLVMWITAACVPTANADSPLNVDSRTLVDAPGGESQVEEPFGSLTVVHPDPGYGWRPAPETDLDLTLAERSSAPSSPGLDALPYASLPAAEAEALLATVPALPGRPTASGLNLPVERLVPPPPGDVETWPLFPPPAGSPPPAGTVDELRILRTSPVQDVTVAPNVSITFSKSMVPLTSHETLAGLDLPVSMSPEPAGEWYWMGTRTLLFQPEGRMPGSTRFRVEIAEGVQAMDGDRLAEGMAWEFETGRLRIVESYPSSNVPQALRPYMALEFDQAIDVAALTPFITLQAAGRVMDYAVIKPAQHPLDAGLTRFLAQAHPERTLVLQPLRAAPANSTLTVTVMAGAPSGEGPLPTREHQRISVRTRGALHLENSSCTGQRNRVCYPGEPFFVYFNHALDTQSLQSDQVRIEPALPGGTITAHRWGQLMIEGPTVPNTVYVLHLEPGLRDEFGQTFQETLSVEFHVGEQDPALHVPNVMEVLSPGNDGHYHLYSRNLNRVRTVIYEVEPELWPEFLATQERLYYDPPDPAQLFGRGPVLDEWIALEADPLHVSETVLDLNAYLNDGQGHLVLLLETPSNLVERITRGRNIHATWLQATALGLDAFADQEALYVKATDLATGASRPGIELTLHPELNRQTTDPQGEAIFASPHNRMPGPEDGPLWLVARHGDDTALLPQSLYPGGYSSWYSLGDRLRNQWHAFTDRNLYQPGETVHVKGWMRVLEMSPQGGVTHPQPPNAEVHYTVHDGYGIEIATGQGRLDAHGAIDFQFTVPREANSGYGYIQLSVPAAGAARRTYGEARGFVEFRIEEFRRPEFEVSLAHAGLDAHLGESFPVSATAAYYGGGALQGAEILWEVTGEPTHYAPPGWDRFTFGVFEPKPWLRGAMVARYDMEMEMADGEGLQQALESALDAQGQHSIDITANATSSMPHLLYVSSQVRDLSQQTQSASDRFLVHPSALYVGMRTEAHWAKVDSPFPLEFIVTDVQGNPVAQREIVVQGSRLRDVSGVERTLDGSEPEPVRCELVSTLDPVGCEVSLPTVGQWEFSVTVRDEQGRGHVTRLTRWAVDETGGTGRPGGENILEIVPDRDEYQPGDVAELLVRSPFLPAYGTVLTNRSGVDVRESITITQPQHILRIPIEEHQIPNLHVMVYLAGSQVGDGSPAMAQPVMASGQVDLSVPAHSRELDVTLDLEARDFEPGGEVSLTVRVRDPAGLPVSEADVALLVVDEAILALTAYRHANPLDTFYPHRYPELNTYRLRAFMQPGREGLPSLMFQSYGGFGGGALMEADEMGVAATAMSAAEPAPAMARMVAEDGDMESASADMGAGGDAIRVRQDFNPLALFEPSGQTDEAGGLTVQWRLPDTVSRYRVVAMAVAGEEFYGLAEDSLTARLPVQIRTQWPRFLNFGDALQAPLLVENQTGLDQDLHLVVQSDRLTMAYRTADGLGYDALALTVPAQSRRLVMIPLSAQHTGDASILASVFNDQVGDHALRTLPIYTPATQEGFAAYGIVEETADVQRLRLPEDIHPEFGHLAIGTSSTILQSLTDGYRILTHPGWDYPEGLASRLLSNLALRDVLQAFAVPDLPDREAVDQLIQDDLEILIGYQNHDGGFPTWRRGQESWPYVSVHALHALVLARAEGYAVPDGALDAGMGYLNGIERHFPRHYGEATRRLITAYALYVRSELGDVDTAAVLRLLRQAAVEDQPLEVLAWSLLVLRHDAHTADAIQDLLRFISTRVNETTGKAEFASGYREEDGYLVLDSDRRSDALLLQVLMELQPDSDLISKVMGGILAARRSNGHWGSSQDNVFVLLAMNQYFHQYEAATPDFQAQVWLDDTLVMNAPFAGREAVTRSVTLPMPWLFDHSPERLQLVRAGAGRMYYRVGLDYIPSDLRLAPRERGFTVLRTYTGVDDPDDVWQDAEGVWHVKLGARVRIETTMAAPGRRYHVLLESPLPAGLEAVNPTLEGNRAFADPNRMRGSWYWYWFDHQQLLDERAQAVTTYLPGGVHRYAIIAEATTPGVFQVPPARAAEIYAPETFGHGPSEVVVVEADRNAETNP